jgi:hypothetical protein
MIDKDYINKILSDTSEGNKENIIGLTKFIRTFPLNDETSHLFQKIIDSNIKEAAEIVFKNRNPETYFSTLRTSRELISNAMTTLVKYSYKTLNELSALSCLGILQNNYQNGKDGLKIYPLNSSDIQHIGKFLMKDDTKIIKIIIDLLDSIWRSDTHDISVLSKNIINSFYDNKKNLTDFIPENLLV